MHFPIEDVVKNVRYFINSVKRATGNTKEAELKQPKNVGNKPGVLSVSLGLFRPDCQESRHH